LKATARLCTFGRNTGWEIKLEGVHLRGGHTDIALDEVEVNVKHLSGRELQ